MVDDEAFAPVARDLRACGLSVRFKDVVSGGLELVVGGVRTGCQLGDVQGDMAMAARVEELAFHTQNAVLENFQRLPAGLPWPACRAGHPHPMDLVRGDDEEDWPHWGCPVDASYRWPVGGHPGRGGR
ncbi:hypothetical protein I5Q34_04930 [Streptomyces sp. AV19]|uniref:hypothetical protein n=1 Tax=Streptomyces sp. AV19 TaxID=2793068 RepID=UPI0018FEFD54|nr:hypothetical protein [Streptomyces sp. AV19]MBH1933643.1 hypothetical protein [Streptomyces sp. AV19]MDG4535851.1 hypothetical protein [Streptomyces sp. AV19]